MTEEWRSIPLTRVAWPIRQLYRCEWKNVEITTLGELAALPVHALRRIPYCGSLSQRHILATIAKAIKGVDVCAPDAETIEQMAIRQYRGEP